MLKSDWSLGMLKGLLKPKFADQGDSHHTNEEAAYLHFVDFMDECEGVEWGSTNTGWHINAHHVKKLYTHEV